MTKFDVQACSGDTAQALAERIEECIEKSQQRRSHSHRLSEVTITPLPYAGDFMRSALVTIRYELKPNA